MDNKSRRDILKFFGAGATILPVVAGMAVPEASAKLIHTPEVDIIPGGPTVNMEFSEATLDEMYSIQSGQRGFISVEVITPEGKKIKFSGATRFSAKYMSPLPPIDKIFPPGSGYSVSRTGFVDTARKVSLGKIPPIVDWELEGTFLHHNIVK